MSSSPEVLNHPDIWSVPPDRMVFEYWIQEIRNYILLFAVRAPYNMALTKIPTFYQLSKQMLAKEYLNLGSLIQNGNSVCAEEVNNRLQGG
ncbi:MAG TPA: hypothetical protein VMW91_06210 [Desulfosporosinus sp.]|nr:hypothetical protein [Desulfosporosinus sp.]